MRQQRAVLEDAQAGEVDVVAGGRATFEDEEAAIGREGERAGGKQTVNHHLVVKTWRQIERGYRLNRRRLPNNQQSQDHRNR